MATQYLQGSGRCAYIGRGARRLVIKPPTVDTVLLVLTTMPAEVAGLVKAWKAEPAMAHPAALPSTIASICGLAGARIVPILESFCHVHDAPPWALREELAAEPALAHVIVRAMLDLVDVPRFYKDSTLNKLEADVVADPIAESLATEEPLTMTEQLVLRVAWKFGQPPHSVLDWPWESFMASVKVLLLLRDDVPLGEALGTAEDAPKYYTGSPVDVALGIGFEGPSNG